MQYGHVDAHQLRQILEQLEGSSKRAEATAIGVAAIVAMLPGAGSLNEDDAIAVVDRMLANPFVDKAVKAHAKLVAREVIQHAQH